LLVNAGKTVFSETFPELWLLAMGGLFIAVVMFFPNGLAGLQEKYGPMLTQRLKKLLAHPSRLRAWQKEAPDTTVSQENVVELPQSPAPSSSEPLKTAEAR